MRRGVLVLGSMVYGPLEDLLPGKRWNERDARVPGAEHDVRRVQGSFRAIGTFNSDAPFLSRV